jgi:hypothetical protein
MHVILSVALIVTLLATTSVAAMESKGWKAHSVNYDKWEEVSKVCGSWIPKTEDVEWGQSLRQSTTCTIKDQRYKITIEKNKFTNIEKIRDKKVKNRIRVAKMWRTVIGEKDRIIDTVISEEWTDWADLQKTVGNCLWKPISDEYTDLNTAYIHTALCDVKQERVLPVKQYWLSGKTLRISKLEKSEVRDSKTTNTQLRLGKKDRWLAPENTYSKWVPLGDPICDNWTMNAELLAFNTIWGKAALQSRNCSTFVTRNVKKIRKSIGGDTEYLMEDTVSKTEISTDWGYFWGKRDDVLSSNWQITKDWQTDTDSLNCLSPSLADSIVWGQIYVRSSVCTGKESRLLSLVEKRISGEITIGRQSSEIRNTEFNQFTFAIGDKDELIEAAITTRLSNWQDYGTQSCEPWSPSAQSMAIGIEFEQKSICEQPQQAYSETLSRWRSGDKWLPGKIQKKIKYFTKTKTSVGEKLEMASLDKMEVESLPTNTRISNKVKLDTNIKYDRLAVSVNKNGTLLDKDVLIVIDANGREIMLPYFETLSSVFFFNIVDFKIDVNGEWSVRVVDSRDSGQPVVISVDVNFIQTRKQD